MKSGLRAAEKRGVTDAAALIDARIAALDDWRGEALAKVRALIHDALPDVTETWKWRGVPVWESHGILCTGESYTDKIKLTFAQGAALPDPAGLFNASLDGNQRRAIDLGPGDALAAAAFTVLIRAAAALNAEKAAARKKPDRKAAAKS